MDINEFKRQLFYDSAFQEKWQSYLAAFGRDIEGLFGGDLGKLIPFAEGVECLYNQKLYDAYCKIRNFQDSCKTEGDRQILGRLLLLCENRKEMATVKVGDWVKQSSHGYYQVVGRTPTLLSGVRCSKVPMVGSVLFQHQRVSPCGGVSPVLQHSTSPK